MSNPPVIEIDSHGFDIWVSTFLYKLQHNAGLQFLQQGGAALRDLMIKKAPKRTGYMASTIYLVVTTQVAEIGTASGYGKFVNDGTKPHIIEAKNAQALGFPRGGEMVFYRRVMHPGTIAQPFADETVQEADSVLRPVAQDLINDLTE